MRRTNYGKLISIGLIFMLAILMYAAIYAQTLPNKNSPAAQQGVLDLRHWDFHQQGMVSLDGQWEFYENELLQPADFQQGARPKVQYPMVPGTWKGMQSNGIPRKGFGTYRLKVLVQDKDEILGMKIENIRMSHCLFINGIQAGGSGNPAESQESHKPGNTPYNAFFHNNAQEIEIIVQVANYMYGTGGIIHSIQFGTAEDITGLNGLQIGTDLGVILLLVMFGAYHLGLYFMQKRVKIYLYIGVYQLLLVIMSLLYGEKILLKLLPDIPFILAYKLLDMTQCLSSLFIILFFQSIHTKLLSRRMMIAMLAPLLIYISTIVVLPYAIHIQFKYLLFPYLGIMHIFIIGRMIYLLNLKKDATGRNELMLFIGGGISLIIYLVDGSLYSENIVQSDLVGKLGVITFVACMNFLLMLRFEKAYADTELLTRQLMVSNQLKDEFLTQTSHELKTPLHGIMNMTSYLLDDEEHHLSAKQRQNLWLIKDTSTKLSMLIQDLIDVSRLKHNELQLHLTVVDMKVITQIVFDVLQFELLGKEVQLDNQVEPDIWVFADENRLRQVMYNLIHNAMKHTEQGTIKVMTSIDQGIVTVMVEDTGTGIPSDKHTAVFEYFEQVDRVPSRDGYTGMGIGLYISRKLIERMGGTIQVAWSEVGQGTQMSFTLPSVDRLTAAYRETAYAIDERPSYDKGPISLDSMDQQGYTVLIVDDESSNIQVLRNMLRRHRYNVITAFSAKEALSKMKDYPNIDLVILDVMMPVTSGIELCQIIRNHYSILDLPILFATAKDTSQDVAIGFRAGANDYVTKPFDEETILARIQTLIAMKTSIREAIQNEQAFYQAQIKPHFLYNALNSVISFCYTDGEKAAHLLFMLSQYLRHILDMDRSTPFVPLSHELELIEAYVEIEKARFGGRFDFVCQVEQGLMEVSIPSLSIQPFVENAIRHGLFEKDGQGKITLQIHEGDQYMKVVIEDDGVGIPDDLLYQMIHGNHHAGGIGIPNIRKRLDVIEGASLQISSELDAGTKVTMYLPLDAEAVVDMNRIRSVGDV
ncbi:hybrid sensor histidine kinase/response regulator [Paenibacillus selenitireducens]|nr:ATP-binding protein [Paenibacillus selenitireducens]